MLYRGTSSTVYSWPHLVRRKFFNLLVFRFFERKTLLDHWPKAHDAFFADFAAENRGFQCGFQMWEEPRPKTVVFSQKPQFSARNCGFQPETAVFSVVFKCGRSQGQKLWFSARN